MLLALLVIIELVYAFIISAGTMTHWPTCSNYYDLLAEGFRRGRLDFPIEPSPQLIAAADPFDRANSGLWLWDASFFDGKFFAYWGPLPALIQAAVKSLLGVTRVVGDQYLCFFFASLYALFGTLTLERVASRLFPRVPIALLGIAVLVFAFVNPIPHSLATPGIYQAAILGGQAFLLLGVLVSFDAVSLATDERRPIAAGRARLAIAGSAFGLALACRISLGPAVALVIAAIVLARSRATRGRHGARTFGDLACVTAPVAVVVEALLLYNELRFGSWFDFGLSHMLTSFQFHTSASCIPLNVYSYACRPFEWSPRFPFVLQSWDVHAPGVPTAEWLAAGYTRAEPVVGVLIGAPWVWFVPIGVIVCVERGVGRFLPRRELDGGRAFRTGAWCCAAFAVLGSATGIVLVPMTLSSMRYLADFSPGLVLLATFCAWCIVEVAAERGAAKRLVRATAAVLGVATIVVGLLLGVQGYNDHFKVHNPALFEALHALSLSAVERSSE